MEVTNSARQSSNQNRLVEIGAYLRTFGFSRQTYRRWRFSVALLMMLTGMGRTASGATIFVTTTQQKIGTTGGCSLQEAIYSANFDNNIAIVGVDGNGADIFLTDNFGNLAHTECVPGNGDDVIVLPTGAVLEMTEIVYDPHNYTGLSATPLIFSNITIQGYGAQLLWVPIQNPSSGAVSYARAFSVGTASVTLPGGSTVSGTGSLTILDVDVKDFTAKGGDASCGGGGGLGAGGAIFVDQNAYLGVFESTLEGNGALGGNVLAPSLIVGCFGLGEGGGGMGGNGGLPTLLTGASIDAPISGGGGSGIGGSNGYLNAGGSGGGTAPNSTCGGQPGTAGSDGSGASCNGGGGGGGGEAELGFLGLDITGGNGGAGGFGGGGGGGGGYPEGFLKGGNGGNGGFGGGGGACGGGGEATTGHGGSGGFGGGAGGCFGGNGGGAGLFGGESDSATGFGIGVAAERWAALFLARAQPWWFRTARSTEIPSSGVAPPRRTEPMPERRFIPILAL